MKPLFLIIFCHFWTVTTTSFAGHNSKRAVTELTKSAKSFLFKNFKAWKHLSDEAREFEKKPSAHTAKSPQHQNVFIIAHADDWQLFMGHHMHEMINNHDENIFIYLTAGDAGKDQEYWATREGAAISSINHLIAAELNVPAQENSKAEWVSVTDNNTVMKVTQYEHQHHYFMRLPDGFHWGQGSQLYENASIFKLWSNSLKDIATVDNYSTYNKTNLVAALHDIIVRHHQGSSCSLTIHTLDAGTDLEVSHSDHYVASLVAHDVAQSFPQAEGAIYVDYRIAQMPPNLSCEQLNKKISLFKSYDDHMNREANENLLGRKKYQKWLQRTYKRERSTKNLLDYVGKPIKTKEI
ncbi:MAG: PIG-L family deacetylase [Oligoflexales bacterium]